MRKKEKEEILPVSGVGERRCVDACVRGVGVRRLVGVRGSVRRRDPRCSVREEAQREEGGKEMESECGGEERATPSPLFKSGRRRSWARDFLRTIPVTDGE